ncbi:hypothetical protein G6F22_014649 [Rhizopus arrhizus]|nr:hypothetical protein G6F22_014649 [Rhizopus arrhizus]
MRLAAGPPLAERTQRGGVAHQLRQRCASADLGATVLVLDAGDAAVTAIEVADHVAHRRRGRMYRHRHHRLQQLRAAFCQCRLDRLGAGAMERHFRGILGMGLSIDQADLDADHRMSLRAFRQCSAHALLHRRDEAARHHATDDAIVEHDLTVLARRHVQHHLRELPLAAGLLDQPADHAGHCTHRRLLVGHARRAHAHLDLPFAAQALDHHLQVQLAHAPDQGFGRIAIGFDAERRVLLGQAGQPLRHPDQVGGTRRLQPPCQHRRLCLDVLQAQRLRTAAQRFATDRILPAQHRDDVTGHGLFDVVGLVGLHPHQAAHTPCPSTAARNSAHRAAGG